MNERKAFQPLTGEENPQFLEDGKRIYLELREKYPNETIEDLDNILNGLCAAMSCLLHAKVPKDNRRVMVQIIHKILMDNLRD